ncbi:response regulator [Gammaproteobacteria bacterium ESL0073]|nr:response regulator [Gammaproteobacteria bacterium ESL0073]
MTLPIDILIVEDEPILAGVHAEIIGQIPAFKAVAIASSLQEAKQLIPKLKPQLILLDNYLPDGKGIDLFQNIITLNLGCHVIFITAASDMQTCSDAIRLGAFDYIIKPISYERLKYSLSKFESFIKTQKNTTYLSQQKIDELFNLQRKDFRDKNKTKGIEEITLQSVQNLFITNPKKLYSAETVAKELGMSKTTVRRYLEYCIKIKFLTIQVSYGNVGRPERFYIKE